MTRSSVFQTLAGTRRKVLLLSASALGAGYVVSRTAGMASRTTSASDWPVWAPSRQSIESRIAAMRAKAVSVRKFGARLDGITDDSAALEQAYASGAAAIVIDGPLRLTRSIRVTRPLALLGSGRGPHIVWSGERGPGAILVRAPDENDRKSFVRDIIVSGIEARRTRPGTPSPVLLHAVNVRGLVIANCRTSNMGLGFVTHMLDENGSYKRAKGSPDIDPAVVAGFSPTSLDDLNEDIVCLDNDVDNGVYQSALLRFNFARRVVVAGNSGRYAKVSWWGGGAKAHQGGQAKFLRRVRDVYIADNTISGANGCIYGNNGQNVVVARNRCSDALDTAIDFEGCIDCHAYDNTVRNAGNFGLSTFYVARNIVFERNYVEQDGGGADLPTRFGRRIGGGRGIYLVGLRSAGFARSEDISVRFSDNTLVFSAREGIGACLPSYYDSVVFTGNTLRNVACDWRYPFTHRIELTGNKLVFDRPAPTPVTLLAGSARESEISRNTLEIGVQMPDGSIAVGYELPQMGGTITITDNQMSGAGADALPIAVDAIKKARGRVAIRGQGDQPVLTGDAVSNSIDIDSSGRRVERKRGLTIPRYPAPAARKEEQDEQPAADETE